MANLTHVKIESQNLFDDQKCTHFPNIAPTPFPLKNEKTSPKAIVLPKNPLIPGSFPLFRRFSSAKRLAGFDQPVAQSYRVCFQRRRVALSCLAAGYPLAQLGIVTRPAATLSAPAERPSNSTRHPTAITENASTIWSSLLDHERPAPAHTNPQTSFPRDSTL